MGLRDRLRLLVRGDGRTATATTPRAGTVRPPPPSRDTMPTHPPLAPRPVAVVPPGARVVSALDAEPGPVCVEGPDEELSAAVAEAFAARGAASSWVVAS